MKRLQDQSVRRRLRVRAKISGTAARPRLAVSRTLVHISAQLIDDRTGRTLASARDMDLGAPERAEKKKTEIAFATGKLLAVKAKEKNITSAVFDRRDKRYHGRVQALADGAREGGLQF